MSDEEIWDCYELELKTDPQLQKEVEDLEVDLVTWKTYILRALKDLHGLFGSAIDTDILRHEGKTCIVKVQKEDAQTFTSSLTSFVTDLSIFGHQNANAYISHKKISYVQ